MALRKLGDGSIYDTDTGNLVSYDVQREAAARRISEQSGHIRPRANQPQQPIPNRGQQIQRVQQVVGPQGQAQTMIQPRPQSLAVNPYELGMGASPLPVMSDGAKKVLLTGLIVGGAFAAVWLNGKLNRKPKHEDE
jgi:hypothetical protein